MLSVFERVLLLQDLEFFGSSPTEHLADFASLCEVVEAGRGSVLFRSGDVCRSLYILARGKVVIEAEAGSAVEVQGDLLDCWSFFSQEPHRYTARTVEECTLLTVPFSELAELLTAEPEFCWALTRQLAGRGYREGAS
ncbi:MAG: Crp/Fnr family transcriptional regulator [Acidobacteriota bacterium]